MFFKPNNNQDLKGIVNYIYTFSILKIMMII